MKNKTLPFDLEQEIKRLGPESALAKQFIPSLEEKEDETQEQGKLDPIGDTFHTKMPGLIHRYPHKVLLLVTNHCPVICRFCFRKNLLEEPSRFSLSKTAAYIEQHPEVNEVILSGGDPLIYSNEKLLELFQTLSTISHVKYARIHTKVPIVLPSRITKECIEGLQKIKKLYTRFILVVHINHPEDLYQNSVEALTKLVSSGIEIKSQSVLLKGINDNPQILKCLFQKLIEMGISPYYLHHTDPVKGGMHFMVDLEEGKRIYQELRLHLPSWACPRYVIEQENGGGKVDVMSLLSKPR
jgi:lysine 2,3-aminomutase